MTITQNELNLMLRGNILSILKLKNYFTRMCVKDRKKKEGKRGEEGGTTIFFYVSKVNFHSLEI
jgi:hypothetical protein